MALAGPDGIGKFTLAHRLVHLPEVQERYRDGILWLDEDGSGYPRQWLRDYCAAIDEPAPFDDNDGVDQERFRALLAGRQVLFVAGRLSASDMLPTLKDHAGPASMILILGRAAPSTSDARTTSVAVGPLGADAQMEASRRYGFADGSLPTLDKGNPLILRPASVGAGQFKFTFPLKLSEERLASSETEDLTEDSIEAETRAVLSRVDLDSGEWLALRRLIITPGYATRFPRSEVAGGTADLDGVIGLGLVEDLGAEVRLHPLLRSIIPEIDPETEEIRSMLWELERSATPHRRRVEIGKRLDALRDPRRGVGVNGGGTPDIAWCPVPGGDVTIEIHADPSDPNSKVVNRMSQAVEPFHIARYPITVAQYRAFLYASDGWRDPAWWADDLLREPDGTSADAGSYRNYPVVNV